MGRLIDGPKFTGTVGSHTAYKMKGSDEAIIRKRGEKPGKSKTPRVACFTGL